MLYTRKFWLHVLKDGATSFIVGIGSLAASGNLNGNIGWAALGAAVLGVASASLQKMGKDVVEAGG